MNLRTIIVFGALLFSPLGFIAPARADLAGHPSAVCGGVLQSMAEVERAIAERLGPAEFNALTVADPNLEGFAKVLSKYDSKSAKEARDLLALHRTRTDLPGIRTAALLFTGEGAEHFLKSSLVNSQEIAAQARKNSIFKKWLIVAFGLRSALSLAGIANLLTMESDQWWYAIPAAIMAAQFGVPAVKSLLRLKESPLQKFIAEEFKRVGTTAGENTIHTLTIRGRSTSDFKSTLTFEESLRAPWAQEIIFDSRPLGLTRVKRVFRRLNPLVIPRKTSQIDLIAMPIGTDGKRQILVLTAEGI